MICRLKQDSSEAILALLGLRLAESFIQRLNERKLPIAGGYILEFPPGSVAVVLYDITVFFFDPIVVGFPFLAFGCLC
jgi:hypothetical protein